jgi:N-acetylmuramoyl-L-alanine amidase
MKKLFFIFTIFTFFIIPLFYINASEPIRILLVPGHDNKIWGAQYGNIKEADMNLVLATQIYNLLKADKRFEVWISRDSLGYTKEFADYFSLHRADIISFMDNAKIKMQDKIDNGSFVEKVDVQHNVATLDMAIKLYGINKWADENKIDAVIHVHFNDYPLPNKWSIGKYKGFAIYIPEGQMVNSQESTQLAKSVFSQLSTKYIPSTYKKELGGLTPDQNLIGLGSNDTLSASVRSILIEYGYIYQKIFRDSITRHQAYKDMANLTFKGIKNYFFGK